MKIFGITGGIGMGKTVAEEWLRTLHIPVVDTDALARELVQPGSAALREIQTQFGNEVLDASGCLRRGELARIVFSNGVARQTLEGILHPRIRSLWKQRVQMWDQEKRPQAAVVIPLLFETEAAGEFDLTICLACSAETQRARLNLRGWTDEQISQRIAAQWPVEKKMAKADYVVWTEGSLDVTAEQLRRIVG